MKKDFITKLTDEEVEALALYYHECEYEPWTSEGAVVLYLIDQILKQFKKPEVDQAKEELVFNPS